MIQLRKTRKMASCEAMTSSMEAYNYDSQEFSDRLKSLYPMVDEKQTPLPRCWSPKDKFTHIGLSQNNLRVHYKGTQNLCWLVNNCQLISHTKRFHLQKFHIWSFKMLIPCRDNQSPCSMFQHIFVLRLIILHCLFMFALF